MRHPLDHVHDPSRPSFPRLPRFRTGEAVTVGVPQGWVHGGARDGCACLACGDMFRVLAVYPTRCRVLRLRSLTVYEIEKADLVRW